MKWKCHIPGKADTDWDGGYFPLTMEFSEDYPAKPPKVHLWFYCTVLSEALWHMLEGFQHSQCQRCLCSCSVQVNTVFDNEFALCSANSSQISFIPTSIHLAQSA